MTECANDFLSELVNKNINLNLSSCKGKEENTMTIIAIDAGHGGKDCGAIHCGVLESEVSLNIAYHMHFYLQLAGCKTLLIRDSDIFVSLPDRVRIATQQKADLFITVHCNANANPIYHGMEVYTYTHPSYEATELAKCIDRLMRLFFTDHRQRGIKTSEFYLLKKTKCPAVFVETEFLSNYKGRQFLKKVENQRALGYCLSEGVLRYLRNKAFLNS